MEAGHTKQSTGSKEMLSPVLQNNLVLERSKDGAGQGKFENCFSCAEVPDEDFPWDLTHIGWYIIGHFVLVGKCQQDIRSRTRQLHSD
jgi:hypothetical protein